MKCANLSVIGFTDDFVYESTKHKFDNIKISFINVTELESDELYRIYEQIPESIRLEIFQKLNTMKSAQWSNLLTKT